MTTKLLFKVKSPGCICVYKNDYKNRLCVLLTGTNTETKSKEYHILTMSNCDKDNNILKNISIGSYKDVKQNLIDVFKKESEVYS